MNRPEDHSPFDEYVLMPHDGFAYRIRLIFLTSEIQDEIAGYDGTFEFKRHFCRRQERVRSADVVQEAGKVVGFGIVGPRWKVRFDESSSLNAKSGSSRLVHPSAMTHHRYRRDCYD